MHSRLLKSPVLLKSTGFCQIVQKYFLKQICDFKMFIEHIQFYFAHTKRRFINDIE